MMLALDDLPRDPDRLLQMLQQVTEVIAQQNASLVSLQAERDTAWSERDAAQAEIECSPSGLMRQTGLVEERRISGSS
jgi:hypothetical protein